MAAAVAPAHAPSSDHAPAVSAIPDVRDRRRNVGPDAARELYAEGRGMAEWRIAPLHADPTRARRFRNPWQTALPIARPQTSITRRK